MGKTAEELSSHDQMLQRLYNNQSPRRRVPRRAINQSIGLLISGEYFIAKAFEIGEGGMLIESPTPLRDQDLLVITIRIRGVVNGALLAKVIYTRAANSAPEAVRYGISFEKVGFEVKRQIRNFVAANTGDGIFETIPDKS